MIGKLNHAGMALFVFLSLSAVMLWMTGNLRIGPASNVSSVHAEADNGHELEAGAPGGIHSEAAEHDHDEAGVGVASLSTLEEQECEHNIRTIDCNSCRFELGVVKLQPSLAQTLISTGSVEERVAANVIRVTGEVQRDPTRVVEVPSLGAGRVTEVKAFLGQPVKQGDVLAVLHSSELGEAKATFLEAHAKLQLAQATLRREEDLFRKKISSEADYFDARKEFQAAKAQVAAAEKRLHLFGLDRVQVSAINAEKDNGQFAELILRAPRSGTIVAQSISEGKLVDGSQSLYTIADLSNLWVWCNVYERDLAVLHDGLSAHKSLEATVEVAAFPGSTFHGRFDLIGSEVDEHIRTIKVRVQVENEEKRLKPGMFADVEILVPSEGKLTVVPRESVLCDEGRFFVFQHWRDNLWVRRDVRVGRRMGPYVEVLGGIPMGARIVTAGAFMLKSDVLRGKMGAGCAD